MTRKWPANCRSRQSLASGDTIFHLLCRTKSLSLDVLSGQIVNKNTSMGVFVFVLVIGVLAASGLSQEYKHYCFANASFALTDTIPTGLTLQRVVLMTRHGDRTPVNVLPLWLENVVWNCSLDLLAGQANASDSTTPARLWRKQYVRGKEVLPGSNCLFGQLTQHGAEQHRVVGASFRSRYVPSFLPPTIDPSLMYLRSTDLQRTILSAYNFMEGLYPGAAGGPNLLTLNMVDADRDSAALPNEQLCPRLKQLYAEVYNSSDYVDYFQAKLGALAAKYGGLWNVSVTPLFMSHLNDVLRSRLCHDMALPPGMSLEDAEQIVLVSNVLGYMAQSWPEVQRLATFPFLSEWLDALQGVGVTAPAKFVYYSAHDSTIRLFLLTLHASDGRWPPLASHVVTELYADAQGNQFVQMQYDGEVVKMLPPCKDYLCPLADFVSLVNSNSIDPSTCFSK